MQPKRRRAAAPAPAPAHSDSSEDHLERIAELTEAKGSARVTDLAEALGLRPSSVSNMVRRLAARGLVNYERYRGFTLTDKGRTVAAHIKARHEILTQFFTLMGLSEAEVRAEVEDIEHHLRPRTLKLLGQLAGYWRANPVRLREFLAHRD
jgi:Mn-dependent DtxR family transcriptional regulator